MARECWMGGPPGTGKTTTLAEQVERAVSVVGAENIVLCSFTRAAARELAGRDMPIPARNVATLHALAFRALGAPKIITPENKWGKLFQEKTGLRLDARPERGQPTDAPLERLGLLRAQMVPLTDARAHAVQTFAQQWSDFKREHNLSDFDDLIHDAAVACPHAPGRPTVFIVDEGQDLNPAQFRLCRAWGAAAGHTFLLAGDPDQTLYQWTGASPDSMTLAAGACCDKRAVLRQSYRVPRAVHAVAQQIVTRIPVRDEAEYRPRAEEGAVERIDLPQNRQSAFRDITALRDLVTDELAATTGSVM